MNSIALLVLASLLAVPQAPAASGAPATLVPSASAPSAAPGAASSAPQAQERRQRDRVAAVVNGEVITLSEIQDRAGAEYRRAMEMPPGPARDQARVKALRSAYDLVVAERLVEHEVKVQNIEVTEAQVDAAVEDVKKRNNLSDDVFRQALASEGLTIAVYRAKLRKDFENHLLISAKVQNRVKVTDDDVRAYYQAHLSEFAGEDQVKLRLILLQVANGASPADEERARASGDVILSRLAAGEDFADLARQLSQGPGASSGGDLGWVKKGTMPGDLERVAFTLQPGQNSGLVRARTGWIILKCDDRKAGKAPPLDEVKERIRERVSLQQAEIYRKQYIDELRREATIEVKVPELEAPPGS